jgi:hypothetical protein
LTSIEEAILRTVIYADVFSFPLTLSEIHHFLIAAERVSLAQIEHALATSPLLKRELDLTGKYIACAGRSEIVQVRAERDAASQQLWQPALHYGQWLARLPFVRMVALTGALAMRNASDDDDDLDYVLVTAPGRVWLARAFAIVLVGLAQQRHGMVICPNYVLAQSALVQEKRDLFMAHEVAQMVPLYGGALYRAMRAGNGWVAEYLPNASGAFYVEDERLLGRGWGLLKRAAELLLGGRIGDALESWEYRRKLRRFAAEMQTPHSAALLDNQHVKGHFNDHGHPVLQRYYERMQAYNLEGLPLAGD